MLRLFALVAGLALALWAGACAHRDIRVLNGPPTTGYRTLGMVSGNGDNESAAMERLLDQASRLEADAVVVLSARPLGSQVLITARAIRYIGPPPAEPAATPPAEPAQPQ